MSDEIYKLMKKNLSNIKSAAPLQGFYDAETLEEKPEDFIFNEDVGEKYKVYEYKKHFRKVLENVFMFYLDKNDFYTDTGKELISAATTDRYGKDQFAAVEDIELDLSFLDRLPKIKNFLISECERAGLKFKDIIVLFVYSERASAGLSYSPEFLLHDIGHTISIHLKDNQFAQDAHDIIRKSFPDIYSKVYYIEEDFNVNLRSALKSPPFQRASLKR